MCGGAYPERRHERYSAAQLPERTRLAPLARAQAL